jgi:hypothetical protein
VSRVLRWALPFALAAALAAAMASGAAAAALSSSHVWQATFSGSSDSAEFNVPSDGGTHGNCTRRVSNGAAWYTHVSSASDGGATRCYPAQLWEPNYFNGVIARGRFYVDVDPDEVGNDQFFSLMTLSLAPSGLVTLNLKQDSTGPTAGKLRLLLWHVPYAGQGDQTRNTYLAFPLRQWVEVVVTLAPSGAVEVRQNGTLVLTGQKRDAPGQVEAAHFGGYASAPVSGWVVGNDDLRIQANGTSLPPASGGSPRPAARTTAPSTTAPRTTAPRTTTPGSTTPVGGPPPPGAGPLAPIGSTPALTGDGRANWLRGGAGDERLAGRNGNDVLLGRGGSDLLMGGAGDDRGMAGAGIDHLYGGSGRDLLFGGAGKDLVVGGPGRDGIVSGPGNDRILAADGAYDLVRCGPGDDRVLADGADRVLSDCELVQRR